MRTALWLGLKTINPADGLPIHELEPAGSAWREEEAPAMV
jgi:hypothetical protein